MCLWVEEEAGEQQQAVLLPPDPQTHPAPQQQAHQSSLVWVQGPTTPLDLCYSLGTHAHQTLHCCCVRSSWLPNHRKSTPCTLQGSPQRCISPYATPASCACPSGQIHTLCTQTPGSDSGQAWCHARPHRVSCQAETRWGGSSRPSIVLPRHLPQKLAGRRA